MRTSQHPVLSVVIPTYQGAGRILTVLRSLEKQTLQNFEVVVVIDGSTDDTEVVIREASLALDLRLVIQENKGRAGARNAGIHETRSNAIVFFDDDVTASDHTVATYYTHYEQGKAMVMGGIRQVCDVPNDFLKYYAYLDAKWMSGVTDSGAGYMKVPYMSTANVFIRKDAFLEAGGFDDGLRDAEDFDLAVRLFDKGIKLYYDPSASVGHLLYGSVVEYVQRQRQYRAARKVLRERNPLVLKYSSPPPGAGSTFKRLVFRALSAPRYVRWIDAGVFGILPRRLRYRLYDAIMTANTMDFT
ncbi:glycosyltransferase family 2 protein [Dawidia soli]|uniref:Glycosyltransferase family 2 protein n=1 Tax=Dawidia soli TaxID=2782352 RepID=A0AAP2DCA4_9BACT|nr:glycosyltransferase family A protein [Dawidia soli]MBT1686727.1 glycosyltransferase family 2 protein [Dawidia soli]